MRTAELLYKEYRRLKGWSAAPPPKDKPWWQRFEAAARLVDGSCGHIDPLLYIEAVVKRMEPDECVQALGTMRSVRTYRVHVELVNCERTDAKIVEAGVKRSINSIARFMLDHGMDGFGEYVMYDHNLIPRMARDLSSGAVTKHFLALVPDLESYLSNYPQDIEDEYFRQFMEELPGLRAYMVRFPTFRALMDKLEIAISRRMEMLKAEDEADNADRQ